MNRKLERYEHDKRVVICSNHKRTACSWTVFCLREGVGQCSDRLHADRGHRGHMTRNEKAYWMIKRDLLPVIALNTSTHARTRRAQNLELETGVRKISGKILYSWFRASWLYINKIQQDATVCRYLFTAKSLYVFRASIAPIIRSTKNCHCSNGARTFLQHGLIKPRWRKVVPPLRIMTCTRGCSYSFLYVRWWAQWTPETCRV